MKKIIVLCVLLIVFSSFGLNKIVIPQRASTGSTITASKTNENLDTIASKVNKLIDSLDAKFPRFTDYSSGDSTLVVDTSYMRTFTAGAAGITAANIDTSHTRHSTVDSATIPVFKGNETHRGDSVYFAGIGRFAGKLYALVLDADSIVDNVTIGLNGKKMLLSGNISNDVIDMIFSKSDSARFAIEYRGSSAPGVANKNRIVSYYDPISIMTRGGGTVSDRIFIDTGNGYVGIGKTPTTALDVNGVITTTTLNTGNGDNELYPMNQAVRTTDDVTHDSNTVTDLKVLDDATIDDDLSVGGGITIAGGSQLTAYLDTTFYDSLYDDATYRSRALCRIIQVGKLVTLYQSAVTGTVSGGMVYIKGIPSKFSPSPLIIFSPTLYGSIAGTYTNLLFTYDSNYYLSTISNTNIGAGTLLVTYSIVSWVLN